MSKICFDQLASIKVDLAHSHFICILVECANLGPKHNNAVEYKSQPQHLVASNGMLLHLEPLMHMAAR